MAQVDEQAQRMVTIAGAIVGVGAKVATALLGAIGDISTCKHGRELAAWVGTTAMLNRRQKHPAWDQ